MARKNNKNKRTDDRKDNRGPEEPKKPVNKQGSKDPRKQEEPEVNPDATQSNDPEWYSRDPELLRDAGSIPFSDVMGRTVNFFPKDTRYTVGSEHIESDSGTADSVVPGICVCETYPSFGDATDRNSPINVAATALYTHVRYNNSGRKNYDAADLMLYVGSVAELFSYIMWLQRIYNSAFIFSQRNIYVGKALLEAQRIDPSIIDDLAAFRYWINVFINKVSSYAVPASLYLFKRRAFMFSNIYTESPTGNIKDQLYMFNPAGFYKFKLDSNSKGMLEMVSLTTASNYKLDDLIALGEDLLSDMWGDEDFGLMSGDVLRSFQGDIITLAPLAEEGGLIPIYDPFVLHQMKNAVVANFDVNVENSNYQIDLGSGTYQYCRGGNVYQDANGNLVSHWIFQSYGDGTQDETDFANLCNGYRNAIISLDAPVSDPAMVVEITRLMSLAMPDRVLDAYKDDGTALANIKLVCWTTGSDVVARLRTVTIDNNGYMFNTRTTNVIPRSADRTTHIVAAQESANFEYLPMLFTVGYSFTFPTYTITSTTPIADLKNYTVQNRNVIKRLHELSLLSLLYVPGVAKQINYMK